MKEEEIKQFVGMPVEAVVMDSKVVIKGVLEDVNKGYVKFSSIEDLFVLVHGKRLSIKLMLVGSFAELGALLEGLLFPREVFDKCRRVKVEGRQ